MTIRRNFEERPPDWPAWDSDMLRVKSEPMLRANYRLLQSWYRQTVLLAPAGRYRGKYRGNQISPEWLSDHPNANFLTKEVIDYVTNRVPEVLALGGAIEETRLKGNLLSSQPLCFNLFGHLRAFPEHAATVLAATFDLDIEKIETIEVEWAPDPSLHLGDKTAFDAFAASRQSTPKISRNGSTTGPSTDVSRTTLQVDSSPGRPRSSRLNRPTSSGETHSWWQASGS